MPYCSVMAGVNAAPNGAPPHFSDSDLATLRARLQQAGLRATRARLSTLAALDLAPEPLSHDALASLFGQQAMDRVTVYRNLIDLTRCGLVRREHSGDRIWRYRLSGRNDAHKRAHPHFSCNACGDTQCLNTVDVHLEDAVSRLGLDPEGVEVTLKGQCARCSALAPNLPS